MDIPPEQLAERPRKIGLSKGRDVYHLRTKGGFHVIAAVRGRQMETLGTGPLKAVAKFVAEKQDQIEWTELNKSDDPRLEDVAELVERYSEITTEVRKLRGDD